MPDENKTTLIAANLPPPPRRVKWLAEPLLAPDVTRWLKVPAALAALFALSMAIVAAVDSQWLILLVVVLVFLSFAGIALYGWRYVHRIPALELQVCRDGTPTMGVIVSRKVFASDTFWYIGWVECEYLDSTGQRFRQKFLVLDSYQWMQAIIGAKLTVLYLPDKPQRSVAYGYCRWVRIENVDQANPLPPRRS